MITKEEWLAVRAESRRLRKWFRGIIIFLTGCALMSLTMAFALSSWFFISYITSIVLLTLEIVFSEPKTTRELRLLNAQIISESLGIPIEDVRKGGR